MIKCPNCNHQEYQGALFCSECGAQLSENDGLPTYTLEHIPNDPVTKFSYPPPLRNQPEEMDAMVTIYLVDSGESFPLAGKSEFTLGRVSKGQSVHPDIDLSKFNAYEQGVSRLHASIEVYPDQVTVTDLGSANSTRVNGKKIPPHSPSPVRHGDIVSLGKLKIQMMIRET